MTDEVREAVELLVEAISMDYGEENPETNALDTLTTALTSALQQLEESQAAGRRVRHLVWERLGMIGVLSVEEWKQVQADLDTLDPSR